MNRHFTGTLATILAIAMAGLATAQSYPMPYPQQAYPAQNAVYFAPPGQSAGVNFAAAQGMMPPGAMPPGAMPPQMVQLASCTGCDTGSCDSIGCDSPCCGVGGCSGGCGGGNLFSSLFAKCGGACGICECGVGYDGYNSQILGKTHGPYGSGGCCLPRWFDFAGEFLFWQRDYDGAGQFSSRINAGNNVLDASDLEFNEEAGFRMTGAYLIAPATALEASYIGGFNWSSGATATGAANLFSVFSNFGQFNFNGFTDTDNANLHSLAMSSELNSGELNLRQRYVSANCLFQSSLLVGVRYVRFREDLLFHTETNTGGLDYRVKADNDLVGVQIGGDSYLCISPRFKFGGEVKAGVYGTGNSQRTSVDSVSGGFIGPERVRDNDVAFVGEAGLTGLYRITSRATLRAGYQVLFIDGVATGLNNFNAATPFAQRPAVLNNDGDLFFHGAKLGVEFAF